MPLVTLGAAVDKTIADVTERVQRGGVEIIGLESGFPPLDNVVGGFRRGAIYLLAGRPGMGKLLNTETIIPTPSGWIRMGDISVGTTVLDENGLPCRVTFVSDVETNAIAYRVTFDDGEYVDACADHQWFTITHTDTKRLHSRNKRRRDNPTPQKERLSYLKKTGSIKTTQQIRDTLRVGSDNRLNHFIPVAKPLDLPKSSLPIAPYTFGAWLGDGTAKNSKITYIDEEITSEIEADGYRVRQHSVPKSKSIEGFVTLTKRLGVYNNKHIPMQYLRASYDQRLALLQGLMDTDGHADKNGMCEIVQKRERLARDIKELVHTLGMKCTLTPKKATINGKDCGTVYRVRFAPNAHVFRLSRKVERCTAIRRPTTQRRYIVSVEPIDPIPMRCISVDSPNNLYLAGPAMIPTHNTAMALSLSLNIARKKRKVLFLSLEMSAELLALRTLSSLTGIPAGKIERGRLTKDEFERVQAAQSESHTLNLGITDDSVTSEAFTEMVVDFQQTNGLDFLVIDYVSLFRDPNKFGDNERLGRISNNMMALAKQCNTPVLLLGQLNREVEKRENHVPILSDIRDSGSLEQDAFCVIFTYRPYYYEMMFDGAEPQAIEKDAKIIVAKNRQGEVGQVGVWFHPAHMLWTPKDTTVIQKPPPTNLGPLAAMVRQERK